MKSQSMKSEFANAEEFSTGEKGFSLVELLIAMVIFLIVTGAIYGLLQVGRIDRNRSSRRSDVLKNARVAVHLIGRDTLNAGLGYHRKGAVVPDNFVSNRLGVTVDADSTRDMLTSVIAGNNLNVNDLQPNPAIRTDIIAFAYRDMDFNVIQLASVTNPSGSPGTPRLTSSLGTGAAAAQQYDLFLLESDTSQSAFIATQVNGSNTLDAEPGAADPLGINQPLNGGGQNGSVLRSCIDQNDSDCTNYNAATLKRFFFVSYKVKQDGTLVRVTYGNNRGAPLGQQIVETPLAYNVEDLQIEYVLENGVVTTNPTAGVDGIVGTVDDDPEDFNLIRQITVVVRVQSTETDEQTGRAEAISLTATFSARNMEYDAG